MRGSIFFKDTLSVVFLYHCQFGLSFVTFSVFLDDLMGQVFALFVLTVAAAESAVGLAIIIVYYRIRGSISMDQIAVLKG